jgi:cell fate regulator YaaT (PSP1 superfamily)
MTKLVQVRLREAGNIQSFMLGDLDIKKDDYCIIQSERGLEYGQIVSEPHAAMAEELSQEVKMVVRKITINDRYQIIKNIRDAKAAFKTCLEKIKEHVLPMKLVDVEYAFDRTKIVFYFTSDGRVDFRELVKDLARVFKSRIELRQIGVRDEAKLIGGIGPCGLKICCAAYLRAFDPINIRMAKDQNLSLNPTKISGVCGRLLCCLKYENDTYCELGKRFPPKESIVATPHGEGKIIDLNILAGTVKVLLGDEREILCTIEEIKVLKLGTPRETPIEEINEEIKEDE